jgi:hypothetical protein
MRRICWFSSFEWLDIYMHKAALPPSSAVRHSPDLSKIAFAEGTAVEAFGILDSIHELNR